jgi:site-specific recombinase XerD
MESQQIQTWLNSLGDDTKRKYIRYLEEFTQFKNELDDISTNDAIEQYLENIHNQGLLTATLWSILSILNTFQKYTEDKDFYKDKALFVRIMKQWEKKETSKKSQVSQY